MTIRQTKVFNQWIYKECSFRGYMAAVDNLGYATQDEAKRIRNIPPESLRRVKVTVTVEALPEAPGITDELMKRAQTSWDAPGNYCIECAWRTDGWCPLIEGFPGEGGYCSEFRKEGKDG